MFFDDIDAFQKAIVKQRFEETEKAVKRRKKELEQAKKRIAELDRIFKRIHEDDINEFVKRIIVHATDKSSGHRRQKVEIVWNFIGNLDTAEDKQTVERQRKGKTA